MDEQPDIEGACSSDGRFQYLDRDGQALPKTATIAQVGRVQFVCRNPITSEKYGPSKCSVNCANAGYVIKNRNWQLTGTLDKPTLSPSINCHDCWHGYIRDGVFVNTSGQPEQKQ